MQSSHQCEASLDLRRDPMRTGQSTNAPYRKPPSLREGREGMATASPRRALCRAGLGGVLLGFNSRKPFISGRQGEVSSSLRRPPNHTTLPGGQRLREESGFDLGPLDLPQPAGRAPTVQKEVIALTRRITALPLYPGVAPDPPPCGFDGPGPGGTSFMSSRDMCMYCLLYTSDAADE